MNPEVTETKPKVKKTVMKKKSSETQKSDVTSSTVEPTVEPTVEVKEEHVVLETPLKLDLPVEVPVDAPVEVPVTQVVEESNTEILFNKLINQFQDIQMVMKTLHSNLKVLQKEVLRERKESKKKESKIKKKSDKKKNPSGIVKPIAVSTQLANFLGLSKDELIARTDVTSRIIAYIKEHNLQNPVDKRTIIPDTKLLELLKPEDKVVTFFNLQTFLKVHFIPEVVAPAVVV